MKQKSVISILLVLAAFIAASWLGKTFIETASSGELITGRLGVAAYVAFIALNAVIVAPVGAVSLIPLATEIWGMIPTALLNIVGWTIGSIVAFGIARIFGRPYAERLAGAKNLNKTEKYFPRKNLFWNVVLLRMVLPVDILSYALGIFSTMRLSSYTLATLIGVTPFAFVFSYAAALPLAYQLGLGAAIIAFVAGINVLLARRAAREGRAGETIITMYYWAGEKLGIKIRNSCAECDINHGILEDMQQKEFKDKAVRVVFKPWLSNLWESLLYGGWHAPVVIVNGRLFSQGIVIDRRKLSEMALV